MDESLHLTIDQYVSGELSATEREAFESLMASDPTVAQEVALQRDIAAAFQEPEVEELERKLAEIMQDPQLPAIASFFQKRKWLVAAIALMIVGLGFLYAILPPATHSSDQLFATYTPIPGPLYVQNGIRYVKDPMYRPDSLVEDLLGKLQDEYARGKYEEGLFLLADSAATFERRYPEAYEYYKGMFLLGKKDYPASLEAFKRVKMGPYALNADWYKALLRLKLEGKTDAVRAEIERFTRFESLFQKNAKEILARFD